MYMDSKPCKICKNIKLLSDFYKNEKMKDGYHSYCKQCLKEYSQSWGKTNRPRLLGYQKKYNKRIYHVRLKFDPKFKVDRNFSTILRRSLNGKKNGRPWESLVGYTLKELMEWLETQFTPTMNWNNYGTEWHIDHIKPRSLFRYNSPLDPEFKACWALSNLQPLEAKTNLIKGNKYSV